jgi:hypothetical protein
MFSRTLSVYPVLALARSPGGVLSVFSPVEQKDRWNSSLKPPSVLGHLLATPEVLSL